MFLPFPIISTVFPSSHCAMAVLLPSALRDYLSRQHLPFSKTLSSMLEVCSYAILPFYNLLKSFLMLIYCGLKLGENESILGYNARGGWGSLHLSGLRGEPGSSHPASDNGTTGGLNAGLGNSSAAERILNFGLVKLPSHFKGIATVRSKNLSGQIRNVSDAELLKSANTLLRFYVV